MPFLILALLACSGGDPELRSQRAAMDAWKVGEAALEAGEPGDAAAAFERARKAEPSDPLLVAWHARALAAGGDLEGAVALLEGVLGSHPRFVEARYNRAAYLARLGRLDEAGPELARAIDDGALRSREAMVDPDFAPHLEHPALAFLPDEMLLVAVDAPSGTLFWGSEATLRLRVVGAQGAPASVVAKELSGPIELVHVIEDVVESTEGPVRDLSWTFKIRGAGEAVLGPITITSGPWSTEVRAVRFPTTAPPGKGVSEGTPAPTLPVPTEVAGTLDMPGVRFADGVLEVKAGPRDRVTLEPRPADPPVLFELRDRSRPIWILRRYWVDRRPSVEVSSGNEVVLRDPE